MSLQSLSASGFGIIGATAFVFDGWRSPANPDTLPWKSPRFRGLSYLPLAAVIPGYQFYRDPGSKAIVWYGIACAATMGLELLLLSIYAYFFSQPRLRRLRTYTSRRELRLDALHEALGLLQDGVANFRRGADESVQSRLTLQRDETIEFLVGTFDSLLQSVFLNEVGVDKFIRYARTVLELCIDSCLERDRSEHRFRGSIYYFNEADNLLYFIAGAGYSHSARSLSASREVSVAGMALAHPRRSVYWPVDAQGNDTTEHVHHDQPEVGMWYQSIVAYSTERRPQHTAQIADVQLVFSFDCKELGDASYGQYMDKIFHALSFIMKDALVAMKVTQDDLDKALPKPPLEPS